MEYKDDKVDDKSDQGSEEEEVELNEQELYEEELMKNMEFSDEEDEEEGGHTIKNAAQYLKAYNPPEKYGGMKNDVNMKEYFNFFL